MYYAIFQPHFTQFYDISAEKRPAFGKDQRAFGKDVPQDPNKHSYYVIEEDFSGYKKKLSKTQDTALLFSLMKPMTVDRSHCQS